MNITDTDISAFLDNELPEEKMAAIREQIAQDDALATRVEQFAQVDMHILNSVKKIDDQALPKGISDLLADDDADTSAPLAANSKPNTAENNVVPFPKSNRLKQIFPLAAAACFVFLVGYGSASLNHRAAISQSEVAFQEALNTAESGEWRVVNEAREIRSVFSFKNSDGSYCRVYSERHGQQDSENLACQNTQGQWETLAKVPRSPQQDSDYQTASGPSVLDHVIDQYIADTELTASEEAALIKRQWKSK